MKLHLPKVLLTAVLAVMVMPTAWAASTTTEDSGWGVIKDNYGNSAKDSYAIGDATIAEISTSDSKATAGSTLFLRSNNSVDTATVTTLNNAGRLLTIDGWWKDDTTHPEFEDLTIGTLNLSGGATITIASSNIVSVGTEINVTGGNNTIKGDTKNIELLNLKNGGSLSFSSGSHNVGKINMHCAGSYQTETLTIAGATVNVTGFDTYLNDTSQSFGTAVVVGHWHYGASKIVVGNDDGAASVFNVTNGTIRMSWDSGSSLDIKEGGTVNAKGIQFATNDTADEASINVIGGRLNLGDGGISILRTRGEDTRKLNLDSGTLGALAETIAINADTITIEGTSTIDTAIVGVDGVKTGTKANIEFSEDSKVLTGNAALTIKGGGSVSFASPVEVNETWSILDGTTLTLTGVTIDVENHQLDLVSEDWSSYFTNDGTNSTTNGFKVYLSTYRLFDGYEWSGTVEGFTVGVSDGDTTVTAKGMTGTLFYVNGGSHTISTAGDYINERATQYHVESGSTLIIDGNQSDSMSASTILSTTTGAGNIALTTAVTMSSAAQATGKLTIENGAVLTMDVGRDNACTYLASFSSIDLNNATIEYHGSETTLNNVTVGKAGAGLHIEDMGSNRVITFAGTTTLDGNLSIESRWGDDPTWKYDVNIANLTGSGDLTIKGTTHTHDETIKEKNNVTAKLLSSYTGAITAERSTNNNCTTSVELTTAGDVSLKGLNLLNGATGKITASGTLGLGDVDLTGGSTLTIMNSGSSRTTTMQSLDVTGQAVVQIERDNSCHNGTINIGALNGENATVTFRNGSYTTNATAFNLNGGAFSGAINVEGNSAGSYDRKVELNLNSGTVAEKAVIQFLNPTTSDTNNNNKITLGVGAAEVKVAGLSGETTNAATVKSTDAAATRTLVINTAENEIYTTNAVVDSSVNLHKTGAGTQEFSADMSGYTGSIAVMAGELSFSATELMNVGGVNVGTAGTLTAHATDGRISTSGQVELAAGATINGSITLNTGATLEMTGLGTVDRGITLNGELVIKDKQTFVTALSSYVKSRSGVSSIRIFSGLTGLTVGDYTFSAENNLVDLSTWDTTGMLTTENTYFITYDSDNGNVDLSMGEMVPEPTTTTLSLLALTALAARRRRR